MTSVVVRVVDIEKNEDTEQLYCLLFQDHGYTTSQQLTWKIKLIQHES